VKSSGREFQRSLRAKMALLLVAASLVPLGMLAAHDLRTSRRQFMAATEDLLAARADELMRRIDGFNENFLLEAERLAAMPAVVARVEAKVVGPVNEHTSTVVDIWRASNPAVRAITVLDARGVLSLSTEKGHTQENRWLRGTVQEALRGKRGLSGVFLDEAAAGAPTIAYLAPVRASAGVVGVVVLWVRAEALWSLMRTANQLAGAGSYAALVDRDGIRIAHTFSDEIVFHPAGALDRETRQAVIAERRFGERTAALVDDVRPFPPMFERARALAPGRGSFRGHGAVNRQWNYAVARRCDTAPWTVFYLLPQSAVEQRMAELTRTKVVFAAAIMLSDLLVGLLLAGLVLAPIRALSRATAAVAAGDLAVRVPVPSRADELGQLAQHFNVMVDRLEAQAKDVASGQDQLEQKVNERTAELLQAKRALEAEVNERRRAHAELAVRESELRSALDKAARHQGRLTALFESGIVGVIVGTLDGRIIEINDTLLDMLGYTRDEVLSGKVPWTALTPPEWKPRDEEALSTLRQEGTLAVREKEYLHKDGHRVPVMAAWKVLDDPSNEAISIVLDLSHNRRAALAISHLGQMRASEAQFRALLEAVPDGVVISRADGEITYVNGQTERLFGYDRTELIGQPVEVLIPERLRQAHPGHRRDYSAAPQVRPMGGKRELYGRRRNGDEVPIEVSLSPLHGEQPLVISSIRDITERKRAEELRFHLAAIVESSGDAIIGKTLEGIITSWNDGATRIFGYTAEEIIGRSITVLIPPERQHEEPAILARLANGERIEQFDTIRLRKDGRLIDVSLTSSPVRDSHGRLIGASKIVRDITERRRGEEALARAKDLAEAASRELEAFSYSVAHDLRAPLRGMNGFAHLLLTSFGDKLDAEGQDWLQEIVQNAKKMAELIDALLSLARVTRSELKVETVDLSAAAAEIVAQLRAADPGRNVETRLQEGLSVEGDPRLLRALLDNLLGNAWKFSGKVPVAHIEFGAVPDAPGTFFVRDDGAGFAMTYAGMLFAPFQRLHTTAEFSGTGIGLATAQRIVRRHGGRIWAEGAVGQGATFFFTLSSGNARPS